MNIRYVARLFVALTCLVWCSGGMQPAARAAVVYENYTFTTYAGPAEGFGCLDGLGTAARFYSPGGIGADGQGNLYVADTYNHTIRKISPQGLVTTFAGTPRLSGTINGTGSAARFKNPYSLAVDANGIIYVADTGNHAIRKITPAGVVSTLAGKPGTSGSVNGTGANAQFYNPSGVTVDGQGNVYVADTFNQVIRKITPAGVVTTVAGKFETSGSANGVGANARFNSPYGVAADANGNLFVADTFNHTIRKITPAGVVTTLAGSITSPGSTDGIGSNAKFNTPVNLMYGSDGSIYVADTLNHTIRKITLSGEVTTLAGLAGYYGSDDGSGSGARFTSPFSLTMGQNGNLYAADSGNSTIRRLTPAGQTTTFAGAPSGLGTADGPRHEARFSTPSGVAVDDQGNLFIADFMNHTIRKIDSAGQVTTFAGSAGILGSADGAGQNARFQKPAAIAIDGNRNLYVADTDNQTIRKITPAGVVTTLAGSVTNIGSANGTGRGARFYSPYGIAATKSGTVYVCDTWNHTIRKISPSGVVTTLAGSAGLPGSVNGVGAAARFAWPLGIAVDASGNLYVADSGNQNIRKVTAAGQVTTLAGAFTQAGSTDGTGSAARFKNPYGVAVDKNGYVYVAETGNCTIRKISPSGVVKTIGGRMNELGSVDGTGGEARFAIPEGIAVDQHGNVYVADARNQTIRIGTPALTDKAVANPAIGGVGVTRQLDITQAMTTSWTWSVIRAPGGATAQVSAANIKNPTFTPDKAGTYLVRFQGWNAQGQSAIKTVILQADATPPTLTITQPTPNFRTTNLSFKVTGTAKDNFGVGKVYVQNNGGSWIEATGTSNWWARVNLGAQNNVIRAYAVDTNGNASAVQTVTCYGVAFTPLSITFSGKGTVTPNYRNALLEVGKVYSITASPQTGYAFSRWTSSQDDGTNRPTYKFIMRSNLVLTAHFNDIGRPTIAITSPAAGQRYTNENVVVSGTATDSSGIGQVFVKVNNRSWITANGTTGWSVATMLDPGTNRISAYAVDTVGNRSLTNSRLAVCAKFNGYKGTYTGLFLPDSSSQPVTTTNAGSITVTLADIGAVSGKVIFAGKTNRFTTALNGEGKADLQLQPAALLPQLNIHLELRQDAPAAQVIGTVAGADWTAELLAVATAPQTARAGKYTFLVDGGTPDNTSAPAGFSGGTITVNQTGTALLVGNLADGTPISYGGGLSSGGKLPVHIVLQGGKGLLIGWLAYFEDHFEGSPTWIKAPVTGAAAKYYPQGFSVQRALDSAKYTPPTNGVKLFGWTDGTVTVEGGNLTTPLTIPVRLTNNLIRVVGSNPYKWTITMTASNGVVSGSFIHPTTQATSSFKGAIVKDLDATGGWFLGTNQSGSVWIERAP